MNSSDTRRFGGICRLYGNRGFEALARAHVCVVGLGGVGSWCAEALARTGVGALTLIDADIVAESNINRQLPAIETTIGRAKVEVLAERFAQINPHCAITAHTAFVQEGVFDTLIAPESIIVDAIDSMPSKAALIAWAHKNARTIVVCGGAGGRTDPACIATADLALTTGDALLAKLRTRLRKHYGFAAGAANPKNVKRFGVQAVFCAQPAQGCAADAIEQAGAGAGFGTSMVVTATLGLRAASCVIDRIVAQADC